MERHSSVWSYMAAGLTAVFGGLTLQEFAVWVGIITTIATFAVNWYYKEREADRRERRELTARERCDP